jgi:hypothetical protein
MADTSAAGGRALPVAPHGTLAAVEGGDRALVSAALDAPLVGQAAVSVGGVLSAVTVGPLLQWAVSDAVAHADNARLSALVQLRSLAADGTAVVRYHAAFDNAIEWAALDAHDQLSAALSAEVARAGSVEVALSTSLSNEVSRAGSAEVALVASNALSGETSRATSAETSLTARLSAETSRATAGEGSVAAVVSSEASRATSTEASLSSRFTALASKLVLVDGGSGNDATGVISGGGPPFATIGAAIAAVSAANGGSGSGYVVLVQPGTYSQAITLLSILVVRGAAANAVTIQQLTVTSTTTVATLGAGSILEDVTIKVTSSSAVALTGVAADVQPRLLHGGEFLPVCR